MRERERARAMNQTRILVFSIDRLTHSPKYSNMLVNDDGTCVLSEINSASRYSNTSKEAIKNNNKNNNTNNKNEIYVKTKMLEQEKTKLMKKTKRQQQLQTTIKRTCKRKTLRERGRLEKRRIDEQILSTTCCDFYPFESVFFSIFVELSNRIETSKENEQ